MFTITAKIRTKLGKSENRRLRATNKLPAIIYGGKTIPTPIELDQNKIWNIQNKIEFYKDIIIINIDGKEEKVKVQAIQRHVFKLKLTHIDFIRA